MLNDSFTYRWRTPITVSILLAGWVASLFSHPWILENSTYDRIAECSGFLLLIAGIVIRSWSSREISGRESRLIVNTGPYALCRHPQYCGLFLLVLSQLMFVKSLCFLYATGILTVVFTSLVVPIEERSLCAVFGDSYQSYCQEVPRWWPRWHTNVWVNLGPADADAHYFDQLSMIGCLIYPFAAELLNYYRELPEWPHWPTPFV